jgi:hypothetical protein
LGDALGDAAGDALRHLGETYRRYTIKCDYPLHQRCKGNTLVQCLVLIFLDSTHLLGMMG